MHLLPVPAFHHDLIIKADMNGITILKEGRYKKRYTGSKKYAVDINGELRTQAQLKELLKCKEDKPKKKPALPRDPAIIKPMQSETTLPARSYKINKTEIRARIFTLLACQPEQKKELYFWTVTFPMKTTDETIYRIFNTWLTRLRKEKMLREYLWVAERQQNGTLHFHICIPHKMHVKTANKYMAACLITCARAGEIDYSIPQCKRYNGVDIAKNRKNRKVTNFAGSRKGRTALTYYITKYITKNNSEFSHLAWHNSRGFSMLFTGVTFTKEEFINLLEWKGYVRKNSSINNDWFQWHPWNWKCPDKLLQELVKLNTHIQNLN